MAINQNDYTPETWEAGDYLYAKQMTELSATVDKVENYARDKFAGFTEQDTVISVVDSKIAEKTAQLVSNDGMIDYVAKRTTETLANSQTYTDTQVNSVGSELRQALMNKANASDVEGIKAVVNDNSAAITALNTSKAEAAAVAEIDEKLTGVEQTVANLAEQSAQHVTAEQLAAVDEKIGTVETGLAARLDSVDQMLVEQCEQLDVVNQKCVDLENTVEHVTGSIVTECASKKDFEAEKERITANEQAIAANATRIEQVATNTNNNFEVVKAAITHFDQTDKAFETKLSEKASNEQLAEVVERIEAVETKTADYDIEGKATEYIASQVSSEIAKLVDSAPEDYNTLRELSDAFKSAEQQIDVVEASLELAKNTAKNATETLMKKHDDELDIVNGRLDTLEADTKADIEAMAQLTPRVEQTEQDIADLKQGDIDNRAYTDEKVGEVQDNVDQLATTHEEQIAALRTELTLSVSTLEKANVDTDEATRQVIAQAVEDYTAKIESVQADIVTKAAQTDLTALGATVEANKTAAEQLVADLATRVGDLEEKHDEELKSVVDDHTTDIKDHDSRIVANATKITSVETAFNDFVTSNTTQLNAIKQDVLNRATIAYVDEQDGAIKAEVAKKANLDFVNEQITTCVSKLEYQGKIDAIERDVAGNAEAIEQHGTRLDGLDTLVDTKAATTYVDGKVTEINNALSVKANKVATEDAITSVRDDLVAKEKALIARLDSTDGNVEQLATTVSENAEHVEQEVGRLDETIATKAAAADFVVVQGEVAELQRLVDVEEPINTVIDGKVQVAVDKLIDGAPDYLNTLKEISDKFKEIETNDISDALLASINDQDKRLAVVEKASETYCTKEDLAVQAGRIDTINSGLVGKVDRDVFDPVKDRVSALELTANEHGHSIAALQTTHDNDNKAIQAKFEQYVTAASFNETLQTQYKTASQVTSELSTLNVALEAKIADNADLITENKQTFDQYVETTDERLAVLEQYDSNANEKHDQLSAKIDSEVANINATHLTTTTALDNKIDGVIEDLADEAAARKQSDADLEKFINDVDGKIVVESVIDEKIAAAVQAHDDQIDDIILEKVEQHVGDIEGLQTQIDEIENTMATDEEVATIVSTINEGLQSLDQAKAAKTDVAQLTATVEDNARAIETLSADVKTIQDTKLDIASQEEFVEFVQGQLDSKADVSALSGKLDVSEFEETVQSLAGAIAAEGEQRNEAVEALQASVAVKVENSAFNSHVVDFEQFKSIYEDTIAEMNAEILELRNYIRELQLKVDSENQIEDTTPVVIDNIFTSDMEATNNHATKTVTGDLTVESGTLASQSADAANETTYGFVSKSGDVAISDVTVSDAIVNVTAGPTLDEINSTVIEDETTTVVENATVETLPAKEM